MEVFAAMSDPPPAACDACGASKLEKLLFAPAIHYKGSGFYSTDYKGKKPARSGDAGSAGEGGSPGDGSSAPASKEGSSGGSTDGPSSGSSSPAAGAASSGDG